MSRGFLIDTDWKQKPDDDRDDPSCSSDETSPKNDQTSSSNASGGSNSKLESSRTVTLEDEAKMIKEELARHETKIVFRLRIVVILILVAVAAAVSYLIYDITHKAEIAAFEAEFEGNAELIIASLKGKEQHMSTASLFAMKSQTRKDLTSSRVSFTFRDLRKHVCSRWFRCISIGRS
jgi:hypothetical protein